MSLPEFLRPLFWDVDFEGLEAQRNRDTIVARVAEYGTDESVRWLRENYTDEEITQAIESQSPRLSRRTLNLWALWLKKPEDWCTKNPSRPLKGVFWRS